MLRMVFTLGLLGAVFLFSWRGLRPPAPRVVNGPGGQFSAGRALEVLGRVIADETPHPVGSDANNSVRQRIVAELTKIGYQPAVQTAFACNQYGTCATVNNVVARLQGGDVQAVLLAAHYDSVQAGPGASDDGVGVAAVLEIARALKSLLVPRHSIIFLIDDGEEAGLLGAQAFVESHPWAKDIRAVVNLDARGTSGPSLMFETGGANAWALQLFAKNVSHPVTSSLFYTVYKQLPNDTDFTVFKHAGYEGLNFAFIGDVTQYHTPLDNIANVSPASLQHQGENALPSVVALANADLSHMPQSEEVYFTLFLGGTVRLTAKWNRALAFLCALLIGLETVLLIRAKRLAVKEFLRGLSAWIVILTATAILALILPRLIRLGGGIPVNWVAHPFPVELAFWALAFSVVITTAIVFAPACGYWGLWSGVWCWWAFLAMVMALWQPGASYLLVFPAATAALCALRTVLRGLHPAESKEKSYQAWIVILPLSVSAVAGFPVAMLLYDGLGNRTLPMIAVAVALMLTPILPLGLDLVGIRGLRGLALFWTPILVTAAAAFAAVVTPAYSAKSPQRVIIRYWKDADTGKSQWITQSESGRLPEHLEVAAAFQRSDKGPFPWDFGPVFLTPAPGLDAPAPTFTILQSQAVAGNRRYRVLLRSERGASQVMALFPPETEVSAVSVNDYAVRISGRGAARFGGWKVYRCLTTPPGGVEIQFTVPTGKPLEVFAADATSGLPAKSKFLLDARPLTATTAQDGDVTIITRRTQLLP